MTVTTPAIIKTYFETGDIPTQAQFVDFIDTSCSALGYNIQAANVASASTTDIGSITGDYVKVTGTTTINSFGTAAAGIQHSIEFTGALQLTYNATSMILPGGLNITTAAGDVARFVSEGSGNWRCLSYQKADGSTLYGPIYYNVKTYGAKGDGTTDDTAALQLASTAVQATGGIMFFPYGTYLVSTTAPFNFTSGNVVIQGEGTASIIKAKSSAGLSQIIASSSTNTLVIRDIVIDGNRSGGGTNATTSYGVYLIASHAKLLNVEIKNCIRVAVAFGSNSTTTDFVFNGCYIHDNGGLVNGGIGQGLFTLGSSAPSDVRITNCRFEANYNTVTSPGASNAINIIVTDLILEGNYFLNNYNANGGQVALSDGGTGTTPGRFVIDGNILQQTGTFGSDSTCGLELQARRIVASNNIINGATADGIRLQATAGEAIVESNMISCTSGCVNLINSGGSGVLKTAIRGNCLMAGTSGVSVQSGGNNVIVENNYFDTALTAKIASGSAVNCAVIRNNEGWGFGSATYDPPNLADGAGTTTTVTVTDAQLGDFASASFSLDLQGITVTAWVSSANTVSVRFQNESGGALDLGSGTLRVYVEHRTA